MIYRGWRGALVIGAAAIASSGAARAAPAPSTAGVSSLLSAGPDMLGTRAVQIRAERFSDSLKRAREDASASPLLQRLIAPARNYSPLQ